MHSINKLFKFTSSVRRNLETLKKRFAKFMKTSTLVSAFTPGSFRRWWLTGCVGGQPGVDDVFGSFQHECRWLDAVEARAGLMEGRTGSVSRSSSLRLHVYRACHDEEQEARFQGRQGRGKKRRQLRRRQVRRQAWCRTP